MQSQLERAYDLIKQGREQEAIDIIEAVIKLEPDNDDAWWLLANATEDIATRKRALETVLKIGTNPIREDKARDMLRVIEKQTPVANGDAFDESEYYFASADEQEFLPRRKPELPSETKRQSRRRSRGGGCGGCIGGIIKLGCMAIILLAVCGGLIGFGISRTADNVFVLPEQYGVQGALAFEEPVTDFLADNQAHYYTYNGTADTNFKLRITSDSPDIAPVLFLFTPTGELLTTINSFSTETGNGLSYTLPSDGQYIIVVRNGLELGIGNYTLEVVD